LDRYLGIPGHNPVHYPFVELVVGKDRHGAVGDVGARELFGLPLAVRHILRELLVFHGEFQDVLNRQELVLRNINDFASRA